MTETEEKVGLQPAPETPPLPPAPISKHPGRFTSRKGKRKKFIVPAVIVAIVGVVAWKMLTSEPPVVPTASTPLEKMDLVSTISVTGTVESANEGLVYSNLNSLVTEVGVKVGDRVAAGDTLAQLDTSDLSLSIAEQQAQINKQVKLNNHALEQSQKALDNAKSDIANDVDADLISAENALKLAQQELNSARRDLQDHEDDLEYADSVMNDLEKELNRARNEMNDAERELELAEREERENGTPVPQEVRERYEQAKEKYDAVNKEWVEADRSYGSDISSYSRAYRQARVSYENALANKKAAENRASRNLDTLQDEITGQQIQNDVTSMQIALQKYQKDFADSTLKAPISGTVTAVYAKEGAPAGGLMFVVEDTDSLVIKTKLKEYDIASVEVGMPVVIKSDATGEQEFMGHISHISPAAVKSSTGEIQTEGSVEFDAEITLDEQDTGLRVGMNTRMTIETERKDQVWAVPFDAVTTDAQGQDIVYVARTDENGVTTAAPVPVTTGMETDFYIEVNSDQLNAGDLIISDPG
ncbi:efflux RND transporter periplasmic adaptor subunit, partial [Anaerotruncus colihominis]